MTMKSFACSHDTKVMTSVSVSAASPLILSLPLEKKSNIKVGGRVEAAKRGRRRWGEWVKTKTPYFKMGFLVKS